MAQHNVRLLGAGDGWTGLVQRYQKAIPKPENRVAAAIIEGVSASLGAYTSDAVWMKYKGSGGKLDRLAWRAAGYRKPGDKFHGAKDASWWASPFQDPSGLYGTLLAWAQEMDKAGAAPTTADLAQWNPALASGQEGAIADFLARSYQALLNARREGTEGGPKLPGLKPVPTPRLPDKPVPLPTPTLPTLGAPPWLRLVIIGGVIYLILRRRR